MKTRKNLRAALTVLVALVVIVCVIKLGGNKSSKMSQKEIAEKNLATLKANEDELFIYIAYVEDFKPARYHCGARWTIGYGSTVFPKGTAVSKKSKPITKDYGKECVIAHLRARVYPFIAQHVTRVCSKEELLGSSLFIYNVGGANFSGYDVKGKKVGNPSAFLKALNDGGDSYKIAVKMTGFRASGGKTANGLLKRHWVQMAVFCGKLNVAQVLQMEPAGFYKTKNILKYYASDKPRKGYYMPDFSTEKVNQFVKENTRKKTVYDILDKRTQNRFC